MSKISKREAGKWEVYGVRKAIELYKKCRAHNQTEQEAIESVLKYAQSREWEIY